jgi:hypothetical protein
MTRESTSVLRYTYSAAPVFPAGETACSFEDPALLDAVRKSFPGINILYRYDFNLQNTCHCFVGDGNVGCCYNRSPD